MRLIKTACGLALSVDGETGINLATGVLEVTLKTAGN